MLVGTNLRNSKNSVCSEGHQRIDSLLKDCALEQELEPLQFSESRFVSVVELDSSETSTTETPSLRRRAVAGAVTVAMSTRIEAENFIFNGWC